MRRRYTCCCGFRRHLFLKNKEIVGDVSAATCNAREQKLVAQEGVCAPETVIPLPVNQLHNDREKPNVLGRFHGPQGILPPTQTD